MSLISLQNDLRWHPLDNSPAGLRTQGASSRFDSQSRASQYEHKPQIRAIVAFAGLSVDLPENYVHFETNKTPAFLAKFPHGKIPALETKDGFKLFETQAIARYSEYPTSGRAGFTGREYITSVIPVLTSLGGRVEDSFIYLIFHHFASLAA